MGVIGKCTPSPEGESASPGGGVTFYWVEESAAFHLEGLGGISRSERDDVVNI